MTTHLTAITGTIARRVLVNYRVDPTVLEKHLPDPFRPKLINGCGVVGICLIRLEEMRPRFAPASVGFSSENAAHRIAVEWNDEDDIKEGVYIPVRHTNSRFNEFVGGRFFPGAHKHAEFWTAESPNRIKIEINDGTARPLARIGARLADHLPGSSIFESNQHASEFFRCGSVGWSPDRAGTTWEGLKLVTMEWHVQPLDVEHHLSRWFDDHKEFPEGSIRFDSAFLMRNIAHEWQRVPSMRKESKEAA